MALAAALGRPALGVHHLEGHLLSPFLWPTRRRFPFVALLVSGGHTQLMRSTASGATTLLGETIDDAAGEAFDKSAKLLGLGYPGGPALARLAEFGDPDAFRSAAAAAAQRRPRLLVRRPEDGGDDARPQARARTSASRSGPISPRRRRRPSSTCWCAKSLRALKATGLRRLVVAGGVGANAPAAQPSNAGAPRCGARVHYPELALCTDNGAMIALAAALRLQRGMADARRDWRLRRPAALAARRDRHAPHLKPRPVPHAAGRLDLRGRTMRDAIQALPGSKIREVANAGLGRDDVLAFWFGESDEVTPEAVRQAAADSLARGETFYSHNLGLPELRQAIAAYGSRLHQPLDAARVAVTSSGVTALMVAMQMLLGAGDEVVAVVPVWPNLTAQPAILGATVRRVALRPHVGGWRLDLDELLAAVTPRTRVLLVNAPTTPPAGR